MKRKQNKQAATADEKESTPWEEESTPDEPPTQTGSLQPQPGNGKNTGPPSKKQGSRRTTRKNENKPKSKEN